MAGCLLALREKRLANPDLTRAPIDQNTAAPNKRRRSTNASAASALSHSANKPRTSGKAIVGRLTVTGFLGFGALLAMSERRLPAKMFECHDLAWSQVRLLALVH
jgi:hypothetical protein